MKARFSKFSVTIFAALLVCALAGTATAQNILATISIPTASAGQVAVDPSTDMIYTGGGPAAGSSLTVINGATFAVVTTISSSAGVSADMKQGNFWDGTYTGGSVNVYNSSNTQISTTSVGSCPAAVTYDCGKRYMWVASQCGTGNDPVWVFNADSFAQVTSPITPGGTITTPPVATPDTHKLYVTSGGVSYEINPSTFAVSATTFGTVMAIDSNSGRLFATSGNNLQIIVAHTDTVATTVSLKYTPNAMGANNAMEHVYLLNSSAGTIDVYNERGKKITTFTLPTNDQPSSLAVDSVRGRIMVDVYNTGSKSWSLIVMEDLSSLTQCGTAGSCDY